MSRRAWIGSAALLATVFGTGVSLAAWKQSALQEAEAATLGTPEPSEAVTVAVAARREHRRTTTAIGTVLALRSITLRNERSGTVREVALAPGAIVEAGTVLVAFDVSVEEAELRAQEAEAALARSTLARVERLAQTRAASESDIDRARAERDVTVARLARTRAIIAKKTIRAPFRARVGLADVHPGQYLHEGTPLTTLQGVDEAAHVDFAVGQEVAARLRAGETIAISAVDDGAATITAKVVAVDARVDPATRNAMVRARIEGAQAPAPGASVRVHVPVGAARPAIAIPVTALRKGPDGDHVFLIEPDRAGKPRARTRKVETGDVLGDEVLVEAGLAAGDRVAASGSFKLREAALVSVSSAPATN